MKRVQNTLFYSSVKNPFGQEVRRITRIERKRLQRKRTRRKIILILMIYLTVLLLAGGFVAQAEPRFQPGEKTKNAIQHAFNSLLGAIDDLQERILTLEQGDGGLQQKVYRGTIDINADGDIIHARDSNCYHWKEVTVPEINLNKMPNVEVFVRPVETYHYLGLPEERGSWTTAITNWVAFEDGKVLILYKFDSATFYDAYKIVVTYKP